MSRFREKVTCPVCKRSIAKRANNDDTPTRHYCRHKIFCTGDTAQIQCGRCSGKLNNASNGPELSQSIEKDDIKAKLLLAAFLGMLSKHVRDNITQLLDRKIFDRHFHEIMKRKDFPEWMIERVHWDPAYGLHGLRDLLRKIGKSYLVYDRRDFTYRVIIDTCSALSLADTIGIDQRKLESWARELDQKLWMVLSDIVALPGAKKAGTRKFSHFEKPEGVSMYETP